MRALAARLWPWLPALFAAAYLVVLLANLRSIVQALYSHADYASAVYIGELYRDAPSGAEVVLTNFAWYTTLWFEQLTHWVPAHRQVWQLGTWGWSLIGVGFLAWSTWRAAGAWAAGMAAAVLACAGTGLLLWTVAGTGHAPAFAHVCLLGAFLVLLAGQADGQVGGRAVHAGVAGLVAAVTAAGFASDTLLLVAGIAPFGLAGLALGWRLAAPAGRRVAATTILVSVVAVAGGLLIREIMEAQGVVPREFELAFASFDRIAPNFRLLWHGLAFMFNADFGGMAVDAEGLLALACAAILAGAVVVAVRLGRSWWRETVAERSARLRAGSVEASRLAHVTFWLLAGLLVALAFVLTDQPVDRASNRYVVPAGYALGALIPVWAMQRGRAARILVTAGVCLLVGASARDLADRGIQTELARSPGGSQSGPLLRFARSQHVKYGYAGYWDAAPLSWQMKTEVQLYPVEPCEGDPARLCPVDLHRIDSWYTPRPRTRTMLVIDPVFPDRGPREAPASLGRPARTVTVDRLIVHVYPYDIAYRFRKS